MVYKYIDIVGVSSEGITEAVNDAVVEAAKWVKSFRWAEVGRVTLRIEDQKIELNPYLRITYSINKVRNEFLNRIDYNKIGVTR